MLDFGTRGDVDEEQKRGEKEDQYCKTSPHCHCPCALSKQERKSKNYVPVFLLSKWNSTHTTRLTVSNKLNSWGPLPLELLTIGGYWGTPWVYFQPCTAMFTHLIWLYLSYTHISQYIWTVFLYNDIQQRHLRALIVLYLSTIKLSRFFIAFISLPIPFQLGQTWLYFIIRCQDDVKPEEKMFWGVLIAHRWRGRHVLSLGLPVLEQRAIYSCVI